MNAAPSCRERRESGFRPSRVLRGLDGSEILRILAAYIDSEQVENGRGDHGCDQRHDHQHGEEGRREDVPRY